MASTASLIVMILVTLGAVILLHAALWRLVGVLVGWGPNLLSGMTGSAAWKHGLRVRSRLVERHPTAMGALGRRLDPAAFAGLPLTLIVLAALYLMAALAGLIDDVYETEGLVRLDGRVNAFFAPYRAAWLLQAALWLTAIGAGPSLTAVLLTATALLWSLGRSRMILPLWTTFLGAQVTTWTSKYVIDRPRPTFLPSITEWNPSFPSGHATAVTALIGFLGYAVARERAMVRQGFDAIFAAACAVGLICFSRIFLGVHFLSDVLAGLLVGTFWLLVGVSVAELTRAWRRPG